MRVHNQVAYNDQVERNLLRLLQQEHDPEAKVLRQKDLDDFRAGLEQKRLRAGNPFNTPLKVPFPENELVKAAAGPDWRRTLYWNKLMVRWEVLPHKSLVPFQKWLLK